MYVCMYGEITNKQGIEWNMYTTWDASLQVFVVVFLGEPNT